MSLTFVTWQVACPLPLRGTVLPPEQVVPTGAEVKFHTIVPVGVSPGRPFTVAVNVRVPPITAEEAVTVVVVPAMPLTSTDAWLPLAPETKLLSPP